MVLRLVAKVHKEHNPDGPGYSLHAQFSIAPPSTDTRESVDNTSVATKATEKSAEAATLSVDEVETFAEPFISMNGTPSPYPNGFWPKIIVYRGPDGKFYTSTNSRGGPWRRMINRLLYWASYEPGMGNTVQPPPEWLNLEHLRNYLENGHSEGYTVSKQSQYSPDVLSCMLSSIHFASIDEVSAIDPIDITIHAPSVYSLLEFNDLAYQLGAEFRQQVEQSPSVDGLNAAMFFEALTFDSHYESAIVPEDSDLHELQRLPIQRYELARQKEDIKLGIRLAWSALARVNEEMRTYLVIFLDLGAWLTKGFGDIGIDPELEESLDRYKQVFNSLKTVHSRVLVNFASTLSAHYGAGHSIEDLDTAISILRRLLKLTDVTEDAHFNALYNIATKLRVRYYSFYEAKDLEEAMDAFQQALELAEKGLGDPIEMRWSFVQLAEHSDAEDYDIIQLYRQALSVCPKTHSLRPSLCSALAHRFISYYSRGQMHDELRLEEAMELVEEGLALLHLNDIIYPKLLCQMAACRFQQVLRSNDWRVDGKFGIVVNLVEKAVSMYGDHPFRHIALADLGTYYSQRLLKLHDGDPQDARIAHQYFTEALSVLETDHRSRSVGEIRAHYLANLARLHLHRRSPIIDWFAAFTYLDTMLQISNSQPRVRLDALLNTVNLADSMRSMYDKRPANSEAVDELVIQVYRKAVRLLSEVAYLGLNVKARLKAFENFRNLTTYVAAFLAFSKRYVEAIEILEEGRAGFWMQSIHLRTEFTAVPDPYRQRLQSLSDFLEQQSYASVDRGAESHVRVKKEIHNYRQSQEFQQLVEKVRTLPDFSHFLLPRTYEYLSQVSQDGPVITLLSDVQACYVHILKPALPGQLDVVHQVHQLRINRTNLRQLSASLKRSNKKSRSTMRANGKSVDGEDSEEEMQHLLEELGIEDDHGIVRAGNQSKGKSLVDIVLATLWEQVVKPILDLLGLRHKEEGVKLPRIWWCPTGEFTFLPLHAAGVFNTGRGSECCMDYVVSSYTPTLTTLINARQSITQMPKTETRALLAAVPVPCAGERLQGTVAEIMGVKPRFDAEDAGVVIPLPPEEDATVNPENGVTLPTVLERLPEATILHLACHGKQDHNDPLESGFILKDDVLPIIKLMPTSLPRAFLAFLSACETAKGDDVQPDQAVHLAAAMLFAGFKSVVATMWLMSDEDGGRVAQVVYERLFAGDSEYVEPAAVPYALHDAVQRMRKEGVQPSRWAAFIHLGI